MADKSCRKNMENDSITETNANDMIKDTGENTDQTENVEVEPPGCDSHVLSVKISGFDKHSFAIFAHSSPESERCHEYVELNFTEKQLESWEKLLDEWHFTRPVSKLESYMKKGVPADLRPRLWKTLLETEPLKSSSSFNYQEHVTAVREQLVDLGISEFVGPESVQFLCEVEARQYCIKYGQISMEALRVMMMDLDRTYPTHRMFMGSSTEAKEGRAALFRVLATYARYNQSVQYCQGMSALAGMFLMYLDEEDAFWCFVSLLERQKYFSGYFDDLMERMQKHAKVFQRLMAQRNAGIHDHLEEIGVSPLMYVTPWFMCLYTGLPCWDTVLAIWDWLLLHGHRSVLSVGLAIMDKLETEILATTSMCEALPLLLHPPITRICYTSLVRSLQSVRLEGWEVSSVLAVLAEEENHPPTRKKRPYPGDEASSSSTTGVNEVVQFFGKDRRLFKKQRTEQSPRPASLFSRFVGLFRPGERVSERRPTERLRAAHRRSHMYAHRTYRRDDTKPVAVAKEVIDDGISYDIIPDISTDAKQTSQPTTPSILADKRLGSSFVDVENFTPSPKKHSKRRMIRVKHHHPLRELNTPTRSPSSVYQSFSLASTRHAFRQFHTPAPLRSAQLQETSPTEVFSSPEVELKTIRLTTRMSSLAKD